MEVMRDETTLATEIAEVFEKYIVPMLKKDSLRAPFIYAMIDNNFWCNAKPDLSLPRSQRSGKVIGRLAEPSDFLTLIGRNGEAATQYVRAMGDRVRRLEHNLLNAQDILREDYEGITLDECPGCGEETELSRR